MKVQTVRILIHRDPMTKIPKDVFPWEVPVFRELYGTDKVEVVLGMKESFIEQEELPDAYEEYARLRNLYGVEPETKQYHADLAYGRGEDGVAKLEKAMKAAVLKAEKPTKAAEKTAQRSAVDKAQKEFDGDAKPDEDEQQKRDESYIDPLDLGNEGAGPVAGVSSDSE